MDKIFILIKKYFLDIKQIKQEIYLITKRGIEAKNYEGVSYLNDFIIYIF